MSKRRHPDSEGPDLVGGYRQRDSGDQPDTQHEEFAHSEVARFLLAAYFHGNVSLPFIVGLAQLLLVEPVNHVDIQKIAELGTGGANIQNSFRDLLRRMVEFPLECAIATIRLPVKLLGKAKWVDFDLLAPHALFSALYRSNPLEFGRRFYGGKVEQLEDFWRAQSSHPSYANHPMHSETKVSFKRGGCPLFLHGDDVAVIGMNKIWSKAVCILSFGGLLSSAEISEEKHLLICLLFNCVLNNTEGGDTYKVLWHYLTWSFFLAAERCSSNS